MRPKSIAIALVCALPLTACSNDKALHFAAGVATSKYVSQQTQSPLAGCAAAMTAGIAKELYDMRYGGYVEANDALATGVGCSYTIRF